MFRTILEQGARQFTSRPASARISATSVLPGDQLAYKVTGFYNHVDDLHRPWRHRHGGLREYRRPPRSLRRRTGGRRTRRITCLRQASRHPIIRGDQSDNRRSAGIHRARRNRASRSAANCRTIICASAGTGRFVAKPDYPMPVYVSAERYQTPIPRTGGPATAPPSTSTTSSCRGSRRKAGSPDTRSPRASITSSTPTTRSTCRPAGPAKGRTFKVSTWPKPSAF